VAIHSASVALMSNDLGRLPFLVRLSRATTRVIWENMLFGVTFIIVTVTLASMSLIKPMLAAVLHLAASSLVVFNSARLIRAGEELPSLTAAPASSDAVSDRPTEPVIPPETS
jgi:Cd2+/Zn2+-exporting ATPase